MWIAHRGYSSKYSDNTRASFLGAIDAGFDMIELDVHLCESGELVIHHDLLFKEIPITKWSKTKLQNHNIMTLSEYFKLISDATDNKMKTYLDVKGRIEVMNALIDFLQVNDVTHDNIYVGTFHIDQLLALYNSDLPVHKGLITANAYTSDTLQQFLPLCDFFSFHFEMFDNHLYDCLHKEKKLVFLYTCHHVSEYTYIKSNLHYDGIVSNIITKYE